MDIENGSKIQRVLKSWPVGTVSTSKWFSELGVSPQLLRKYALYNWVKPLGSGAYIKTDDIVCWTGGLYAMQEQLKNSVHAGAMTALSMQGMAHYLRMGGERVFLFAPPKTKLPAWFKKHDWDAAINFTASSILPENLGLISYEEKNYSVNIWV
jgi:hypothetical protein